MEPNLKVSKFTYFRVSNKMGEGGGGGEEKYYFSDGH